MNVSCGIVGLPNVGKSTLFNALTGSSVLAANYPFATIEPNTGIVPVPDERLHHLATMYKTNKIVPATVTFVDIAGLVKGASQGEGLGNQFLGHIRNTNTIIEVIRAFKDDRVVHVDAEPNPRKDIDVINTELILADLQTVERRLPKLEKEARADAKLKPYADLLKEIKSSLDKGNLLFAETKTMSQGSQKWLRHELQLLTLKPIIYLFNVDEATLQDGSSQQELTSLVAPAQALFVCARLESELHGVDDSDAVELLKSYGVPESGLIQLIHATYHTLGLQSFLTAGPKEVRAWTIAKGTTAPQAAGVIHNDFERGFIAAQITNYHDLLASGSETAAKATGKVRTEGRDYIMQPDDIVVFRFNVKK